MSIKIQDIITPDIEPRFTQPDGWRWHSFERKGKHGARQVRFGSIFPQDSIPDAVVVCLQGVREFTEKHFETARWCTKNNYAFWMMDWVGQGYSTRYLENPQKRHAHDFDEDVADLHYFILEYIKHSSVHPDKGRIPLAMLGHSMGANIGLRYLDKHKGVFECAAFTAPMIGIQALSSLPTPIANSASALVAAVLGKSYIPGGTDWGKRIEHVRLTQDPARKEIHAAWCRENPVLQCGDVTFGWVHQAQKSCAALQNPKVAENIETPVLFGIPGCEDLVDNAKTKAFAGAMPNATILEYEGSYHEILMEKDDIRSDFLSHFSALIKENIIDRPETLKPF